jgi:hypothetical protein
LTAWAAITEKAWQSYVIDLAKYNGWHVFHALPVKNERGAWRTATQGDNGFPDLVLAHPTRGTIFAELKSTTGRLSKDQIAWIQVLYNSGANVHVWRPADRERVTEILTKDPT